MKRKADAKGKPKKKKAFGGRRSKFCKFCVEKSTFIDYKDVKTLSGLHPRARQGAAPPHQRRVRPPPAPAGGSHQARAQHRAAALRHGLGSPRPHRTKGRPRAALSRALDDAFSISPGVNIPRRCLTLEPCPRLAEAPKLAPPLRRQKALLACWKPILLNWLVPGWGYWLIGEKTRAKVLFGVSAVFCLLAWMQLSWGAPDGIRGGVYVPVLGPIQWLPDPGRPGHRRRRTRLRPLRLGLRGLPRHRVRGARPQPHPGVRRHLHHGRRSAELAGLLRPLRPHHGPLGLPPAQGRAGGPGPEAGAARPKAGGTPRR